MHGAFDTRTIYEIPNYIKEIIFEFGLQFYVSKVIDCPEEFDEGSIIFKFESLEFHDIVKYSGNYPPGTYITNQCIQSDC